MKRKQDDRQLERDRERRRRDADGQDGDGRPPERDRNRPARDGEAEEIEAEKRRAVDSSDFRRKRRGGASGAESIDRDDWSAEGGDEELEETLDRARHGSGDYDPEERYGRRDVRPNRGSSSRGGDGGLDEDFEDPDPIEYDESLKGDEEDT